MLKAVMLMDDGRPIHPPVFIVIDACQGDDCGVLSCAFFVLVKSRPRVPWLYSRYHHSTTALKQIIPLFLQIFSKRPQVAHQHV